MWPFRSRDLKADLIGRKAIKVKGMRFVIKRVNPLLDLPSDRFPQIFTDFQSRRPTENVPKTTVELLRIQEFVNAFVEAGVVDPELVPVGKGSKKGKEEGLTVEDLFRDQDLGNRLYFEILHHSMNRFRGFRKVFFSIRKRLWLFMHLRISAGLSQLTSSFQMAGTP